MTTAAHYNDKFRRPGKRTGRRRSWIKKITWRMAVLIAAAGFVIGYPIYLYLYAAITGGITHDGNIAVVDLKAMSTFEMDQINGTTDNIPQRFRDLDGKRVKLVGQMYVPYSTDGNVHAFSLVYSRTNCCFNGPPKIQHFIDAKLEGNRDVPYRDGFVDVTGILHVGVLHANGAIQSVYRVDVDAVKDD